MVIQHNNPLDIFDCVNFHFGIGSFGMLDNFELIFGFISMLQKLLQNPVKN